MLLFITLFFRKKLYNLYKNRNQSIQKKHCWESKSRTKQVIWWHFKWVNANHYDFALKRISLHRLYLSIGSRCNRITFQSCFSHFIISKKLMLIKIS